MLRHRSRLDPTRQDMLHLSTDRLAALGDEQPTSAEAAHLAVCSACSRELAAYRALVDMAHAERTSIGIPLTRWDAIATALATEAPMAPRQAAVAARWPLRAAAGLLLMVGGAMVGRASAGAGPIPGLATPEATVTASTAPAASRRSSDSVFASVEDARAAQRRSEQLYQQAVAYLAQYDSSAVDDGSPVAYRSRLAVLDRV